ncbi:MAG: dihydropteroate synthase [Desulfobacteraceae bacterium]|nr:dihydropteroate synthase [Desulfobacteraceae bacterium]
MKPRKSYTLSWPRHRLELGSRTAVMGVLNVTPDSFSDGGRFFSPEEALRQGLRLVEEGADILDVGGESTRPFSDPVSEEEEVRRTVPVIEALAEAVSVPISIDTTKASVAKRALEAGASMINDVGALRMDPAMAEVASAFQVPLIVMHMLGTPKTMQVAPDYRDLHGEICTFLQEAIARAEQAGVPRGNIIIDPGIGFGKTVTHNLQIIGGLEAFASLDCPLLVGPSRKAFIRHLLKPEGASDLPADHPMVEIGTHAAVAAAVLQGAHIVRVHDVAGARATVTIIDAIRMG